MGASLLHTEKLPFADYYSVTAVSRLDFDYIAAGQHYPSFEQIAGMTSYLVYTEEFATRCREDAFIPYAYEPWLELERSKQCPSSGSHITHKWLEKRGCLSVSGKGVVTPFLIEANYPVVNDDLGERIADADLDGMEVGFIDLDAEWSSAIGDSTLKLLAGKNPMRKVLRVLADDAGNSCPFCDRTPLYCEECGYLMTKCSGCGNTTIQGIVLDATDKREERRANTETLFPDYIPENRLRYTIDLRHCDRRWDFSGTDLCSRRTVECLFHAGAYPIVVTPLLCVYEGDLVGYHQDETIVLAEYVG